MQLIEIVQIALLLFIAASAIIFLFSYLGYRRKSKITHVPNEITHSEKVIPVKPKVIEKSKPQPLPIKQAEMMKKNPRFEVFTPDNDDQTGSDKSRNKKLHYPKTLSIKHKS